MVRRSPPTEAGGERVPLQCRSTIRTRDRLEEAARRSGRSLSQEMEKRLDESLAIQDAAKTTGEMSLIYIRERDELLNLLLGGPETISLLMDIAFIIQGVEDDGDEPWHKSAKVKAQLFKTLEAALPALIKADRDDRPASSFSRAVNYARFLPDRPQKPLPEMPEGMRFMTDEELRQFFYRNEDNA